MPVITFTLSDHHPSDDDLPSSYQEAAEQSLEIIEWLHSHRAFCKCPGEHLHTSPTKKKHTEVRIDGAPTVICVHTSCQDEAKAKSQELRSIFGKIDKAKGVSKPFKARRRQKTPEKEAIERADAIKPRLSEIYTTPLRETLEPIPEGQSAQFIRHIKLFEPSEWIWHGERYDSNPRHVRTAKTWASQGMPSGTLVGHSTFQPESIARKNENIEKVKFLVIEFDDLTIAQQWGVIAWLREWCGWDLRLVLDAANRSLHAWFIWPKHLTHHEIKALMIVIDADRKMLTDSQPSRVAGAMRDGKMQSILWLGTGAGIEPKTFEEICDGDNPDAEILAKLESVAFNFAVPPPQEECIYAINGVEVAHPGNLETITAQQASGKSSHTAAGLAAPMCQSLEGKDFLGWQSTNPHQFALLHFDTEQSTFDHDALIRRAIRRAGIQAPPPWFSSYSMVGWETLEMFCALEASMKRAHRDFGGIHSVWLDGVADFVSSVNEEEECMTLIRRLHALAKQFNTVIWNILHLNPGSDFKSRGHLGSQIERKAETVIQLKKDGDEIITAYTTKTRRAPIVESRGARFRWSNEAGMHVSTTSKSDEANRALLEIITIVWDDRMRGFTYSDLVTKIMEATGKKETTSKTRISELLKGKLIEQHPINQMYYLPESERK